MEFNRDDGHNLKTQIQIQPNIGLDSDCRNSIVGLLITTLADEAVLCIKTRAALWNVRGTVFSELHTLFESQYQLLNQITNQVAERVRVLGGFVIGSFGEFLHHTRLVEHPGSVPDILRLLADQESLIRFLREDIRKCAEEYEDAGTTDLLVGILVIHEKMAYVLRSDIEMKPFTSEKS